VIITVPLSPVVKYHGLARRHLLPSGFLMRPQLNGDTFARTERETHELGSIHYKATLDLHLA